MNASHFSPQGSSPDSSGANVLPALEASSDASRRAAWHVRELGVILVLLLEIALFAFLVQRSSGRWLFVQRTNLLDIAVDAAVIGVACVGVTLVIIAGGIDLSVGGAIALASVVVAGLLRAGWPVGGAIIVTLLVGAVVGTIAALLVTRAELPPFIATLALLLITRGVAFAFTRGDNWSISTAPAFTDTFGNGALLSIPYPALVLVLLTLIAAWFLTRSAWGRQVFAVGGNAVAARYAGVDVRRVTLSVYVLSGLAAALAGIVYAARYGLGHSTAATGYELDVVAAAVVGGASLSGGRGSIVGAVLGALIFATLRKGLSQVPGGATYNQVIVGLVVIAAVLLDQLTRRRVAR
ncbi:MAG TPA: ABC transporter permease [Abditibacteriaceae bacterium]|jgi:ribose transport system permease protein